MARSTLKRPASSTWQHQPVIRQAVIEQPVLELNQLNYNLPVEPSGCAASGGLSHEEEVDRNSYLPQLTRPPNNIKVEETSPLSSFLGNLINNEEDLFSHQSIFTFLESEKIIIIIYGSTAEKCNQHSL